MIVAQYTVSVEAEGVDGRRIRRDYRITGPMVDHALEPHMFMREKIMGVWHDVYHAAQVAPLEKPEDGDVGK